MEILNKPLHIKFWRLEWHAIIIYSLIILSILVCLPVIVLHLNILLGTLENAYHERILESGLQIFAAVVLL